MLQGLPAAENVASPGIMDEAYHPAKDRVVVQFEKEYLTRLISRAGGNMSKAARLASIDRTTLYRMMERHSLQRSHAAGWVVEREPAVDTPAHESLQTTP